MCTRRTTPAAAADQARDHRTSAVGDVVFEQRSCAVRIGRKRISLSLGQAGLFKVLVDNAGRIMTAADPCRSFQWNCECFRNKIADLRKKLGRRYRKRIVTIKNAGVMYKAAQRKHIGDELTASIQASILAEPLSPI